MEQREYQITTCQRIAIIEELETSIKLIKLGFGELQNINSINNFYFLPFQLLSQGIERFLKIYICLGYLSQNDTFPQATHIKGHDLHELLTLIFKQYYRGEGTKRFLDDNHFLKEDQRLKQLLRILSEFGKNARYYNLDIITRKPKPSVDIKEIWNNIENEIIKSHNLEMMLFNSDTQREVYGHIARQVILTFEKFISALSLQFTIGALKKEGACLSPIILDFLSMKTDDFGTTNYRQETTKYKSTPRQVHKRTESDEYERYHNPNYKWKKIIRQEYKGEWPFYADEVIIECREKHWCIITIGNIDYALNGSAEARYKLENPHEAGMAIIGISISDFIDMASKLGTL